MIQGAHWKNFYNLVKVSVFPNRIYGGEQNSKIILENSYWNLPSNHEEVF